MQLETAPSSREQRSAELIAIRDLYIIWSRSLSVIYRFMLTILIKYKSVLLASVLSVCYCHRDALTCYSKLDALPCVILRRAGARLYSGIIQAVGYIRISAGNNNYGHSFPHRLTRYTTGRGYLQRECGSAVQYPVYRNDRPAR